MDREGGGFPRGFSWQMERLGGFFRGSGDVPSLTDEVLGAFQGRIGRWRLLVAAGELSKFPLRVGEFRRLF